LGRKCFVSTFGQGQLIPFKKYPSTLTAPPLKTRLPKFRRSLALWKSMPEKVVFAKEPIWDSASTLEQTISLICAAWFLQQRVSNEEDQ